MAECARYDGVAGFTITSPTAAKSPESKTSSTAASSGQDAEPKDVEHQSKKKKRSFVEAAEHGREEHQENKEQLYELDHMDITDLKYDDHVHKMMKVRMLRTSGPRLRRLDCISQTCWPAGLASSPQRRGTGSVESYEPAAAI